MVFKLLLTMMTHDYNTRGKKHGNVLNDDDPLTNTKLEENIINHINASVSSLRDEFLNLKAIVIKRLQDEKKYMFFFAFYAVSVLDSIEQNFKYKSNTLI